MKRKDCTRKSLQEVTLSDIGNFLMGLFTFIAIGGMPLMLIYIFYTAYQKGHF